MRVYLQTLRLPIHQKSIYWDQNIMFFALMWKRISPVLRDSLLREREVFYQTILQNLVLQVGGVCFQMHHGVWVTCEPAGPGSQ